MPGPITTLKEWFDNPEFVAAWDRTWNEPHMRAGLQVLISAGLPKQRGLLIPANATLTEAAAAEHGRMEGYFCFMRNIESIKTIPKKRTDNLTGWGDADPNSPPAE